MLTRFPTAAAGVERGAVTLTYSTYRRARLLLVCMRRCTLIICRLEDVEQKVLNNLTTTFLDPSQGLRPVIFISIYNVRLLQPFSNVQLNYYLGHWCQ